MNIEDICNEIISSVKTDHPTQVTKHCTFNQYEFQSFVSQGGANRVEELLIDHYGARVSAWDKTYGGGMRQLMVEISPRAPE